MAGNPYDQFDEAPAAGVTLGTPAPDYPYKPLQAAANLGQTKASTGHTDAETTGQQIANRVKNATADAQIQEARANAVLAQIKQAAAAQKYTDDQSAELRQKAGTVLKADTVLDQINRARHDTGFLTTGFLGSMLGHIPGTSAYDLRRIADSGLGGNIALDAYTQLRADQPGNGQAGSGIRLLQGELPLLKGKFGALDPNMSEGEFSHSLDNAEQGYRVMAAQAAGLDPMDPDTQRAFGIKPPASGSLAANFVQRSGNGRMFAGVTPKQAAAALSQAQQSLARQVANLPQRAQQVGIQHFNADPRIEQLRLIANRPPSSPSRKVVNFNDLPAGN